MGIKIFLLCLLVIANYNPQELKTPLEKSDYRKLTSYIQLIKYLEQVADYNDNLKVEFIAESVEGRQLPAVKISNNIFGDDKSKIKVLIFAQQHGNEQSGKEGALLSISKFSLGYIDSLLNRMDIIIIPQMNPDGSEKNMRRNTNDADLNRDHLVLLQPETQGLHKLFYEYLPEATMDVHEYSPYSEDWIKYGYVKKFDEQVGTTTNSNVSALIRKYSIQQYLPFIENYLVNRGYTFQNYILGGPPDQELMRHSTYDINDGRQGFGILNSFSFIQEGLNGRDSIDNIKRRTEGQAAGMLGFLEFVYLNKDIIKGLVKEERSKLLSGTESKKVAIQLDHFNNGRLLNLNLFSLYSESDSMILVKDYRPVVNPLFSVQRPAGYLFPKGLTEILDWTARHNIIIDNYESNEGERIEQYNITGIDSMNFEGDMVVNPMLEVIDVTDMINPEEFYFVNVDQLQSNVIVIALEPKSMLGLITYKNYEHLLKKQESFPVLRVVNN
jgi:hypothetical protein